MFVDHVTLSLLAGNGGDGTIAWRREKYIPKGGPSGGNGGNGGSIYLESDVQILSLEGFRNKKKIAAEKGAPGGSALKQGKRGKDLILKVPCGTLVKDKETGEILFDFTEAKQTFLICKGGKGGRGNHSFRSPTHQAPYQYTEGTKGEVRIVELELKLIADIGLIGLPNAGKSTLFSKISHVTVKIAPYPFTTLYPNLSYIHTEDFSRILIADIPGLIKDAHQNRGLGIAFLKHIERSSALVYIIDISGSEGRDPFEDFQTLQKELGAYGEALLQKPFLIALNKIDLEDAQENAESFRSQFSSSAAAIFAISAKENSGLEALLSGLRELYAQAEKSREKWPELESNQRHTDFQSAALPTELSGQEN